MTLTDRLAADLTAAMRAKDRTRLDALRTALMTKGIERGRDLDETESLQVVSALVKQRRDSIEQFTKGGRTDLADKEAAEIAVLETYLPPPLSSSDLEKVIDEAIQETGARSPRDMGVVMKAAMAKLAGAGADGKTVKDIVARRLAALPERQA
jgi:uncharacterized protein YqeY